MEPVNIRNAADNALAPASSNSKGVLDHCGLCPRTLLSPASASASEPATAWSWGWPELRTGEICY